ncbi:hypothetical protein [Bradyrhizobium sp.]|uniref:hypothetical protein n=1 Tax=Bradyrhizobium sp. TaxID=376 RepID=UPI00403793B0
MSMILIGKPVTHFSGIMLSPDAASGPSQPAPRFVTIAKRPSRWRGLDEVMQQIRIQVKRNFFLFFA